MNRTWRGSVIALCPHVLIRGLSGRSRRSVPAVDIVAFDSAIPWFESRRPSPPPGSLPYVVRHSENCQLSRRLWDKQSVSAEENPSFRIPGPVSPEESLLGKFSISETRPPAAPETGWALEETGSNV